MNILWDFDGTLFDTYPAYTMMLSEILGESVEKQEIYKNLKISYSHAIQYYNISCEQEEKIKVLKEKFTPKDMKPFAGVEEVLKFADKNAIMTHKHRAGVMDILKYYGWEKYFVDMVTIDDGFPRKPNSLAYNHLHKKHNIDLAIGDRELDLLPAKELGISTCMFQGNCDVADYSLSHYSEFFKVVSDREFSL
ncbi:MULTISPECIES: HAD-IA family hydrolase [Bacillus]|uniref:Phosphoglycolate phosphatase n=1 Tax=Bacillus cereus (strain ATCC 14579 / DSM 31 / CCUG 7414 / JCM 2152 / NBRC 15305 / NCIMB 9373 / NCTC 2599 / NRRL B-3711) TaxID=226900 RepID=Q81BZ6_BACCR|nr:HAD-IA family hydrolase [Bacillus cereus]AAP09937.1 Phosphoglycolate phosphatase [Bacillus cereus ATCC 14579]EEL11047.1 Phosphoglycolate phosphatase [Bacillus cereus BDRD-Cer4]KZD81345.1 hydrolase haloacid dehalogenase-like family [Bacillus cereus]MCC3285097.1 HAD-IA family hydrolase [Bacillus cereus]MEB9993565.1 HAD-IA family hydrolase [Bacillus cereus]